LGVDGRGGSRSRDGYRQREVSSGRWEIGIRDNNFFWVCSDGSLRIRSLISINRGVLWRDYGGLRHLDIVSIEDVPDIWPVVRIFKIYNRNTLRSVNLLNKLQDAERWIVASNMNATPPTLEQGTQQNERRLATCPPNSQCRNISFNTHWISRSTVKHN
jgi:hypothetical protein